MRELSPGIWHWQAPHPDWTPEERWPREVSSCAIDDGSTLLLFDPQSVPDELLDLAATRHVAIVLTAPWHERDARCLVERFDAPVFTPPPDAADDLVRKFGISAEDAMGGSPDLDWLVGGGGEAHFYTAGDRLPIGIDVLLGREHNDVVLWVPRVRAVIPGDTLVDFGQGFEINRSLRGGITRSEVVERLQPLRDLPIEVVLPAHGMPTDRAELERVLS
jgi:hypothetical protein